MKAKIFSHYDIIKVDLYRGENLTGHCDNYITGGIIDLETLDCDRVVADRVKLSVPNGRSKYEGLEIWVIKVRGMSINCFFFHIFPYSQVSLYLSFCCAPHSLTHVLKFFMAVAIPTLVKNQSP